MNSDFLWEAARFGFTRGSAGGGAPVTDACPLHEAKRALDVKPFVVELAQRVPGNVRSVRAGRSPLTSTQCRQPTHPTKIDDRLALLVRGAAEKTEQKTEE